MSQSHASTDAATKNLRFTHKICSTAIGTVCVARSCRALFRLRKPPSLSERQAFRDYEPALSLSCSDRLWKKGSGNRCWLIRQLATVIKMAITANRYPSTLTCPYRAPPLGMGGSVRVARLSIHWAVTNYVTNLSKRSLERLSTC